MITLEQALEIYKEKESDNKLSENELMKLRTNLCNTLAFRESIEFMESVAIAVSHISAFYEHYLKIIAQPCLWDTKIKGWFDRVLDEIGYIHRELVKGKNKKSQYVYNKINDKLRKDIDKRIQIALENTIREIRETKTIGSDLKHDGITRMENMVSNLTEDEKSPEKFILNYTSLYDYMMNNTYNDDKEKLKMYIGKYFSERKFSNALLKKG